MERKPETLTDSSQQVSVGQSHCELCGERAGEPHDDGGSGGGKAAVRAGQ